MTMPQDTPEVFEKYLPYAIALGVENRWADRFAGVLAAASAQGQQGFAWYSGSSSPWSAPDQLRRQRRLVAVERGRLGLDRAWSSRAAAALRAAVAAAAAAAAGSQPRTGLRRRQMLIGSSR